jgi:hypothetical protein
MNDHAYDISHLLASDSIRVAVAASRIVSAPRAVSAAPKPPGRAAAQTALALELMQCASVHDAFVEQFLRMDATGSRGSYA